jgi:DNA mismatch repair protein MLH3
MPSRRSQFLSLGIQPVDNAYGSNILLEEINRVFKDSSFGSREEDTPFFQSERKLKDRQSRRSPDKHPMFYLRIDVHATGEERMSEDSLYAGDSQTLEVILGLLRAVSYGFLKSHEFKPQKVAMSNANSPMSTARKLSKSSRRPEGGSGVSQAVRTTVSPSDNAGRPSSPFDGWNRVKVGAASGLHSKTSLAASFNKARLVGADGTVLRRPFQEFPIEAATTQTSSSDVATSQAELGRHDVASDPTSSELTEPQTRQELQGPGSGWLAEVVQSWENPIFEIAQQAVPMTYSDTCAPGESSHHWAGNGATLLDSASIGLKRRLRKDNLLGAEVISQVDKKFILIRLPSHNTREGNTPTDTTLVMLDQHAADERCQLEDLMAGYFYQDASGSYIANSEPLEKPIVIEMTRSEILLLQQYSQHLQDWGVTYTVQSGKAAENGTGHGDTLWIENLPPSIAERCRTEPKLLVDILRQEIWRLHDAGSVQLRPRGQPDSTPNRPWVGLFRGCPRGILDLLHSRSCRSEFVSECLSCR